MSVNDKVVLEKGFRVDPSKDKIIVEGRELPCETVHEKRYFVFNKPKGVMTTLQDPHAERIVSDYFKDISVRLFPVGRLDRDTTGLLLMTNDGELAFRLTHPRFGIEKRYRVSVRGAVTEDTVKRLEQGVVLEEAKTAPCKIKIEKLSPRETELFVVLHEGKKRQIRRIFDGMGHSVIDLARLSYGPVSLGDLRPGQKRELAPQEIRQLQEATGLIKIPHSRKTRAR